MSNQIASLDSIEAMPAESAIQALPSDANAASCETSESIMARLESYLDSSRANTFRLQMLSGEPDFSASEKKSSESQPTTRGLAWLLSVLRWRS